MHPIINILWLASLYFAKDRLSWLLLIGLLLEYLTILEIDFVLVGLSWDEGFLFKDLWLLATASIEMKSVVVFSGIFRGLKVERAFFQAILIGKMSLQF